MISVSEALQHIENYCKPNKKVKKAITKTMGLVLAEDVVSPINMPPFRQSSMDGYAYIYSEDTNYKVVGEVQAGSGANINLKPGEAVRIFTGAKVPDAADTIVIQENVTRKGGALEITKIPNKEANVRSLGEQIKKGEIALKKGTVLNEASIGFLASIGVAKVKVYKTPKVSILVSGNELQPLGTKLEEGNVYESNSITLQMTLHRVGVKKVKIYRVKDTLQATTKAVSECLAKSDIVLISGGISVGDYDFVKKALEANNVKEVFYKVNQRPGKPLWFGSKKNKIVFALPGNPASSLSCFYLYALPLIKAQMGFSAYHLPRLKATVTRDIDNPTGKTLFLKGTVFNGEATLLGDQASSMLKSFAVSNALLQVPENQEIIKQGEEVTYIQL